MIRIVSFLVCYLTICSFVVAEILVADQSIIYVSAENRQQIHDLISKYSYALDNGREEEWLNLLTVDAWFETPVGNPRGTEQLARWFKERVASRKPGIQVRHYVSNIIIIPISDVVVHVRSMLLYTRQNIKEPLSGRVYATGIYEDEIRLTDKGWRLASHKMAMLLPLDSKYLD